MFWAGFATGAGLVLISGVIALLVLYCIGVSRTK